MSESEKVAYQGLKTTRVAIEDLAASLFWCAFICFSWHRLQPISPYQAWKHTYLSNKKAKRNWAHKPPTLHHFDKASHRVKKARFPALDWINLKIEKETWCSLFIVYSHQHVFTCKAAISLHHFFETQFTSCRWHMTDVTGGTHNNTDGEPAWAQLNIKSTVDIMIFSPQETHALSFTPSCFVRIRLRSAFLKGQEMTKRINLTHTHTLPVSWARTCTS